MGILGKVGDVIDDVKDKAGDVIDDVKGTTEAALNRTQAIAKLGPIAVQKIEASGLNAVEFFKDVLTNPIKTVKFPEIGSTQVGYAEFWASHWKVHLTKEFLDTYGKVGDVAAVLVPVGTTFAGGVAGVAIASGAVTAGLGTAVVGAISTSLVAYIVAEWILIQTVKNKDGTNLFGSLTPLLGAVNPLTVPAAFGAAVVVPLPGNIG